MGELYVDRSTTSCVKPMMEFVDTALKNEFICPSCGYNLRGLSRGSNCPECGASIASLLHRIAVNRLDRRTSWRFGSKLINTAAIYVFFNAALPIVLSLFRNDWFERWYGSLLPIAAAFTAAGLLWNTRAHGWRTLPAVVFVAAMILLYWLNTYFGGCLLYMEGK